MVISAIILAAVAGVIFYYIRFIAPYESTDDAFIEGHVTIVSPAGIGPGRPLAGIDDNQEVKAGDPLLEIDPSDYETKLAQARADLAAAHSQLEQAKAQVAVDEAKAAQQMAAVTAAEAEARRAGGGFATLPIGGKPRGVAHPTRFGADPGGVHRRQPGSGPRNRRKRRRRRLI